MNWLISAIAKPLIDKLVSLIGDGVKALISAISKASKKRKEHKKIDKKVEGYNEAQSKEDRKRKFNQLP